MYTHAPKYKVKMTVEISKYYYIAHGRMVTSSRQITEVKQRRARLVLGGVTAARSSHAVGHA